MVYCDIHTLRLELGNIEYSTPFLYSFLVTGILIGGGTGHQITIATAGYSSIFVVLMEEQNREKNLHTMSIESFAD